MTKRAPLRGARFVCQINSFANMSKILRIGELMKLNTSPGGEIDIQVSLRCICRKVWRFKSSPGHHKKRSAFCRPFLMVRGLEDLASYLFEFTKKVATRCTEHVMFKSSPGHKSDKTTRLISGRFAFVSRSDVSPIPNGETARPGRRHL